MPSSPAGGALDDLRARLSGLTIRDERRLRRRLDRTLRAAPARRADALRAIARELESAERRVAQRAASVPLISYPPELPVSQARQEIGDAIRDSPVVVLAGETGSGKTTQLPKICLELGRGIGGAIGHTQPRRLAARSVADRIAVELGVEVGGAIGYQVRFTDRSSPHTLVKVMTDGILLAEIQRDPHLSAYDTIIVDEAHERSLNIDFLLGYLRRLLRRRADLKVVVTSATIDPARFARHFDDAPVIEVSGRTYPVEVRYRPLDDQGGDGDRDQIQAITEAVEELRADIAGDVLVFLSGEREIRDTAEALRALDLADTEILPLYARLPAAQQQRVFAPHEHRRIVLATNVAETSLTVPGIRAVIDPGTARISRYSARTKVQRLPIEPISQASADQRKGRCGRIAEGICIRLYSEEDFAARPRFTDPEILRTNLASVILQLRALGLGDVSAFPFLDEPDRRSVRDANALLAELGALGGEEGGSPRLTTVGRTLARLPVDPRIGRMILEADRRGALREVLVLAAALSIQDPRERPHDQQAAADEAHGRFAHERSDFLAFLNLWDHLREQQRALSSNQFRRLCRASFLHHLRVREWQDLHGQLRAIARELGMMVNAEPASADDIHLSLLAGLLSHIGRRPVDRRDYEGARGARFTIWPGSSLARRPPAWVMAAELVETSRLWGRTVARIQPEWAERLAPHLVKRRYGEPRWDARREAAVADEHVSLYGIPLVAGRTVPYSRIDPPVARRLFLRHALVEGQWATHHRFLEANRRLLAELSDLEHRTRRRDHVVDDEALFDLYDARVPDDVVSGRHFDAWWKRAAQRRPQLLTFDRDLLRGPGTEVREDDYPDVWVQDGLRLRLRYRFEPGAPDDGARVDIPLAVLRQVRATGFDWQVPGYREELVTELLRALPKDVRRQLVPVPDVVRALLPRLRPSPEPLVDVLAREVHRLRGVLVARDAWDLERIPAHLRITFAVVDGGRIVAHGKDLGALQRRLAGEVRQAVAETAGALERRGERSWTFGSVPRSVRSVRDGHEVVGYPALVDEGATVGMRVLAGEEEQRLAMWRGTRRLLLLSLAPPVRLVHARLDRNAKLDLARNPHGGVAALLADCTACAVDALLLAAGGPAWDREGYTALHQTVANELDEAVIAVVADVARVLAAARRVEAHLESRPPPVVADTHEEARAQLAGLVYPGFVTDTGSARLGDVVRYLQALERRLERAPLNPARDRSLAARVTEVTREYERVRARLGLQALAPAVRDVRWMIEELRVSLFAQQLGTRHPVSEQRIFRALAALPSR